MGLSFCNPYSARPVDLRLKLNPDEAMALRDAMALSLSHSMDTTLAPIWDEVVDFIHNYECPTREPAEV